MLDTYCSDRDLLVHLKEKLPSQLSDDLLENGDVDPQGDSGEDKRFLTLICPASAWIDGVYHITGPFADRPVDGLFSQVRSNEGSNYELGSKDAFVYDSKLGDCIKEFGQHNKIFKRGDTLPADESNESGRYVALIGTPPLIRQACVEYAMSLAWTILNRNTESDLVLAWRKQAMQTLSVDKNGYAQKRPHPFIPHNTGIAGISYG